MGAQAQSKRRGKRVAPANRPPSESDFPHLTCQTSVLVNGKPFIHRRQDIGIIHAPVTAPVTKTRHDRTRNASASASVPKEAAAAEQ
jgi:hypothetical protein